MLVNDGYGGIYRLSRRNYARYLAALAEGQDVSPEGFGKSVGYARSMRDMTPEQASYDLKSDLESLKLLDAKTRNRIEALQYGEGGKVLEAET